MTTKTTSPLEKEEWDTLSGFAGSLADLAATETLSFFRQNPDIENKADVSTGFDPVTLADKRAEQIITGKIKECFPDHGIIGEETGVSNTASQYQWVIDPIDGTGSFVCGIPLWGTLIGLMKDNRPVLGVMDQPFLGERYIGSDAQTVCLKAGNPTRLSTSQCTQLNDARLATTSPDLFSPEENTRFKSLKQKAKLTRFGTDCSAYALLAAGHIDLVVEAGLNSYDILALIPIIEGAGGVVSTWENNSAQAGGQILASATWDLHRAALKHLAE